MLPSSLHDGRTYKYERTTTLKPYLSSRAQSMWYRILSFLTGTRYAAIAKLRRPLYPQLLAKIIVYYSTVPQIAWEYLVSHGFQSPYQKREKNVDYSKPGVCGGKGPPRPRPRPSSWLAAEPLQASQSYDRSSYTAYQTGTLSTSLGSVDNVASRDLALLQQLVNARQLRQSNNLDRRLDKTPSEELNGLAGVSSVTNV